VQFEFESPGLDLTVETIHLVMLVISSF